MLEIKEYVKAESLEQAFELNQKRTNQIIGGMLWMKMGDHRIQTAIDLSGLGLDTIEEDETQFSIGCMTSLRQLELHEGLNQWSDGAVRESVRHIVGVQFRNLATVGGSIFGRFGFSDVLTCFLAMDTYVELHHSGILSLADFVNQSRCRCETTESDAADVIRDTECRSCTESCRCSCKNRRRTCGSDSNAG